MIFPRVSEAFTLTLAGIDEQGADIAYKQHSDTTSVTGDKFGFDPDSSSSEIFVSPEVKTELILLSVKDL